MQINKNALYGVKRGLALAGFLGLLGIAAIQVRQGAATARDAALESSLLERMHESIDTTTGLCVHLGFRDARLIPGLSNDGQLLVHGLASDVKAVSEVREVIRNSGLQGLISAEQGSLEHLPYTDNLANLVVVEHFPEQLENGLTIQEVVRILCPQGTAFLEVGGDASTARTEFEQKFAEAGIGSIEVFDKEGVWIRIQKPRPSGMDVWSHRRYDASGTSVSEEEHVGVPSGLRWIAGPNWATGLRYSAVQAVTASERRLVYFFDDEIKTPEGPRQRFSLVARDAYNGLLLWKRPVGKSQARASLLVTAGNRAYTQLDDKEPLLAIDTATGETVQRYEEAGSPREILLHEGLLIVSVGSREIRALDAKTGELVWSHEDAGSNLLVGDGHVFFRSSGRRDSGERETLIGCLKLKTGEEVWRASTFEWDPQPRDLVFYQDEIIVVGGRQATHAVSAKDGSHLWSYEYPLIGHGGSYSKVVYQNGLVWVHPAESDGKKQYAWEGLDPQTGEIKQRHLQPKDFSMKHRCFSDRGTANQILCGTMDFVDFETGKYRHFAAARHSCRDGGVLPANGLLYTFPHSCHCYPMLRGFIGLNCAPTNKPASSKPSEKRLETGPAFGTEIAAASKQPQTVDWPTLRGSAHRSGSTRASGPDRLERLWEQQVAQCLDAVEGRPTFDWQYKYGSPISSPTVAYGLAFVASTDEHRLDAYEARTGELRWSFTTGGRIDSPPTLYQGLCLFGSRDGWAYALRADDGQLVWRFRAAPTSERILAYGQLESLWPVVGGVLVNDGLAYICAGRHSDADGGIHVSAVVPETGELVWHKQPEGFQGVADLLVGDEESVRLISWVFDAQTGENGRSRSSDALRAGRLGLFSDEWYNRPIALRKSGQQWSTAGETGQLLVFDEQIVSGFKAGDDKQSGGFSRGVEPLKGAGRLFAKPLSNERSEQGLRAWTVELPEGSQVRGMIIAGDRLFVAGRLGGNDPESQAVRIYSVHDGSLLDELQLSEPLTHECLAIAGNRLYVSTQKGRLLCLGTE